MEETTLTKLSKSFNNFKKELPFGESFTVFLLQNGSISASPLISLKKQVYDYIGKNEFFNFLLNDTEESLEFLNQILLDIQEMDETRVRSVFTLYKSLDNN